MKLFIKRVKYLLDSYLKNYPKYSKLGAFGSNSILEYPCYIEHPKSVFVAESSRIRNYCKIINSPNEKVFIKKYTVLAPSVTLITNSHKSTVGIPHICLGPSHINDKSADIIINEDVWVGANVTILAGVTVGRGAVIAAGALVTKNVPPYALVAGAPAKVIARKFEKEDVIRHEEVIYPEEERMSLEELTKLFKEDLADKRTFGVNEELSEEQKSLLNHIKSVMSVKTI